MNYRPLLKSLALLVITWMIFLVAKTTFQSHSDEHLSIIPSRSDAVIVLNNNAVSNKLFYQRVFNEDSYNELVSVDEELEKELIADAIGSGVDIMGTVGVFSYTANDIPILGFTVYTNDEDQFNSFIERHSERLNISDNIVYGVKDKAGVILYADSAYNMKLTAELNKLLAGNYKPATDQPWFEPLYDKKYDLIAYFDPAKSTHNHYTSYLRMFTPEVIRHSYTFMSLEHGELSFVHNASSGVAIEKLLRPYSPGGYNNEGGFNLDISVDLPTYNRNAEHPFDGVLNIRKSDTLIQVHLDSLLNGEISVRIDGVKFNLASNGENGIPFDVFAEMCIGIDQDYWTELRDSLLEADILTYENGVYRLPLKPFLHEKSRIILNLVEREHKLLISVDKRQAENPFFIEDLTTDDHLLFSFDTESITENIRYPLSPDMSSLKDIKGGYMKIASFDGKDLTLEGSLVFRRGTNHSLLEALHIITNWEEYITPMETMLKHVTASDL